MKFLAGVGCWGQLQGAGREPSVRGDKTRWLLQTPTGFVPMFVQVRKMLKAAEAKSEHGGNAPGIWEYLLSTWLYLTPVSLSSWPFEEGFLVLIWHFCLL